MVISTDTIYTRDGEITAAHMAAQHGVWQMATQAASGVEFMTALGV